VACAATLAAAVIVFVTAVFGLGSDNELVRAADFRELGTYLWAFYRQALRDGRMPLWTPHIFGGWPFAADLATHTFYPATLLVAFLSQPLAAVVRIAAHLTLGAIGTFGLLRLSFGLGRGAATFGGLVYALSGAFVGHPYAGHQSYVAGCYLPLVLLSVDRAVAPIDVAGGRRWLAAGALLLGLAILSGGVQYVWLMLPFVALYRIGDRLCRGPRNIAAWRREAAALGTIVVLALGVSAVLLLPAYELVRLSSRATMNFDQAALGSFPPAWLPWIVLPPGTGRSVPLMWEYYGYVGGLPLLLAPFAVTRVRSEPRLIVLLVIGALVTLYMVGRSGFLFPLLWRWVPTFSLFRVPARAVMLLGLIAAIVAAVGLDAILRRVTTRAGAPVAGVVAGLFCLVQLIDVTVCARINRPRLILPDRGSTNRAGNRYLADVLSHDRSWYRYWFPAAVFRPNQAYAVGARSVTGYDNTYPQRYGDFVHHMTDTSRSWSTLTDLNESMFRSAPSAFPFKILGVKYAVRDGALTVNPDPPRRAWFVTRARRVADEDDALAGMRSDRFEPYREVLFEAPEADLLGVASNGTPSAAAGDVDVVVTEVSPEVLRIQVGPHADGWLVLSEMYYPGWHTTVDGHPAPVYRADSILRAVPIAGGGSSEVVMTFAPQSLRWGASMTAATLLILAALTLWPRRVSAPEVGLGRWPRPFR
jgi:hypothetical protein